MPSKHEIPHICPKGWTKMFLENSSKEKVRHGIAKPFFLDLETEFRPGMTDRQKKKAIERARKKLISWLNNFCAKHCGPKRIDCVLCLQHKIDMKPYCHPNPPYIKK